MADDCCNNTTDDDCPDSNPCTKEGRKFFVSEVEEMNAPQCAEDEPCAFTTPYYDATLENTGFVIPAVGETFIISICDNNRWLVGQWVTIPNAGVFEITGKDGCRNLYLRNGCPDGSALPGNANPGKSFQGVHYFWLNPDPGCADDSNNDYCNQVLDAIANCEQELCKDLTDITDEDEDSYRLAAVTHDEEDGFLSCFRKVADIIVKATTLCFPSLPSNSQSKIESVPVQDVQWLPSEGCLAKRALPTKGAVDGYCGAEKTYIEVPADYASINYILGANATTGCPEWVSNCWSNLKPAFQTLVDKQDIPYANNNYTGAYYNYPTQDELDAACANSVYVFGRATIDVKSDNAGDFPNMLLQVDTHNTCQQASQQLNLKVFDSSFFFHRATDDQYLVHTEKVATGFSTGRMSAKVVQIGFFLIKE